MPGGRDALTWLESEEGTSVWFEQVDRFQVGGVDFACAFESGSTPEHFFICKHRPLIEQYVEMLDEFPAANVVELGIAEGGSAALISLVAPPKKLVLVDLKGNRVEALDELIRRLDLAERVHPHYGVDQADRPRLRGIVDDEFGDEQLDLVIDDASHRLIETRASFETLFPRLRPGGLYVIEDWNQQRLARGLREALDGPPGSPERVQVEEGIAAFEASPPELMPDPYIVTLAIELILAQADSNDFLADVTVGIYTVTVRRGAGELDPVAFRLADLYTDQLGLLPGSRPA